MSFSSVFGSDNSGSDSGGLRGAGSGPPVVWLARVATRMVLFRRAVACRVEREAVLVGGIGNKTREIERRMRNEYVDDWNGKKR